MLFFSIYIPNIIFRLIIRLQLYFVRIFKDIMKLAFCTKDHFQTFLVGFTVNFVLKTHLNLHIA